MSGSVKISVEDYIKGQKDQYVSLYTALNL